MTILGLQNITNDENVQQQVADYLRRTEPAGTVDAEALVASYVDYKRSAVARTIFWFSGRRKGHERVKVNKSPRST
jgi:lipase chaperone LimK